MELIGMLDSPYVRRTAISMQILNIEFEHRALSVFRDYEKFSEINPLVKAPTLVCDDKTVLVDSSLILQYLESCAVTSLLPTDLIALEKCIRVIGLALNVCDKSVQYYYEIAQRPTDRQHQPWLERVIKQLRFACDALEREFEAELAVIDDGTPNQAGISTAVAYKFAQQILPTNTLDMAKFTSLNQFSDKMEKRQEFKLAAFGDKPYPVD